MEIKHFVRAASTVLLLSLGVAACAGQERSGEPPAILAEPENYNPHSAIVTEADLETPDKTIELAVEAHLQQKYTDELAMATVDCTVDRSYQDPRDPQTKLAELSCWTIVTA